MFGFVFSVLFGFGVLPFVCGFFVFWGGAVLSSHLQAADLARARSRRQDAPGAACAERGEQRGRDRVLLAVGHLLAEELNAVDGRASRRVRDGVPDHREVLLDVVEARHHRQARGLGLRQGRGHSRDLLRRGHHPLIHAVILGHHSGRLDDGRLSHRLQDDLRIDGRVLADEVHTDDRDLPVGSRVLDGPVLGRLEGLEEEVLGDDVVVHPLIIVPRARLAPLLVVLAVPHDSVALRSVRAGAQGDKGHREVLPDVLALMERGNVVFPAELHGAHGLVVLRNRGLLHLDGGSHVLHTEIAPADGVRCHQRIEFLRRHRIDVGNGGHLERKKERVGLLISDRVC